MSARFRVILALTALIALAAGGPLPAQTAPAAASAGPASRSLVNATLAPTEAGGVRLALWADGALPYQAFALDDPPRVVLDLLGTAEPIPVRLSDHDGFVRKVRCAPHNGRRGGSTVRYVLETSQPAT
jgi:hypothetical protein